MDPQYIQNTVAYNLDTPKEMGFFPISNHSGTCHGKKQPTTSHFSTTRYLGSLGSSPRKSIPCIPKSLVFLPPQFFFSKSQVRLLPLIIGQVELRIPNCFCRPPSITCVRDQGDAHNKTPPKFQQFFWADFTGFIGYLCNFDMFIGILF